METFRQTGDPKYPFEVFLIVSGQPYWHRIHWLEWEKLKQAAKDSDIPTPSSHT